MSRPSNAEIAARYQSKIRASKKWRDDNDYDDTWRRLVRMYRGKHYEYFSNEDRLLVNIMFATANVIAPSVAVNHPKITVNATRPDNAANAIITESVVNYWWKHYAVQPQFRRAVDDFVMIGHGWLKCSYRYVEEEQITDLGVDDASDPNVEGNEVTPNVVVTEDRPIVERVSPWNVYVDPDGTCMEDIGWIAQRIRRTVKEVKADKRYNPRVRTTVGPTSWKKEDLDGVQRDVYDTEEGYCEVWEFYDIRKRTMCVFTDSSDGFLVNPTPMPYAFGHPFVMLRNYDVPDEFYPIGDLEAIEPLQRELNETRTQMMNHRKRFARKWLYHEEAFDDDGRNALESDEDNTMVPVRGDTPLNEAVQPMPSIITPPDFYNQSDLIRNDITQVSGVSEYAAGGMPEIRRTATEAGIIADASNARAADKLAIIEECIGHVAKRMIQLAQQFMTGEQVARITGPNGAPVWITFDEDYIAGEFDFEVEGGSTQPNNESFRRQTALQLVDAMVPFVQMGVVDPSKLVAHVLQFAFNVKDPNSWLMQAAPQPAEQPPAAEPAPPGAAPAGPMPPGM